MRLLKSVYCQEKWTHCKTKRLSKAGLGVNSHFFLTFWNKWICKDILETAGISQWKYVFLKPTFVLHYYMPGRCLTSFFSFKSPNNSIKLILLLPFYGWGDWGTNRLRNLCKVTQVVSETLCAQTRKSGFRILTTKVLCSKRASQRMWICLFPSPQFHSTPRFSPAALDLWQSAHVIWLIWDYVSEDENWEYGTVEVS